MKIAIIGTMGIPPSYGGAETAVNEISRRLIKRGHEVIVYGSKRFYKQFKSSVNGIEVYNLPFFYLRWIDFPMRRILSTLHVLTKSVDVVHFWGMDGATYSLFLKMKGIPSVITLDGFEWERSSYSSIIKFVLRGYIRIPKYTINNVVIDSIPAHAYYINQLNIPAQFIPYGANLNTQRGYDPVHRKLGLKPDNYILFVGRLVDEKGVHILIEAYSKLSKTLVIPLVIVGGSNFRSSYITKLKTLASENVIFTGPIWGKECSALFRNARLYVSPSFLEGTSPAILESLGSGNCTIVSDISMNRYAFGNACIYFKSGDVSDLSKKIEWALTNDEILEKYRDLAINIVKKKYSWDKITSQYERIYIKSCIAGNK